jgi:chromosome partitioning protein
MDHDGDGVGMYRRIADVLRSAQRVAIEAENAPDKRKRLRTFSTQEVAALLGIKSSVITSHARAAEERNGVARTRHTLNRWRGIRVTCAFFQVGG